MINPDVNTVRPRKSIHNSVYMLMIERLIDIRREAELSQSSLAEKMGRPQSFVAKVETRERRLDVIELIVWMQAMDVDPAPLIVEIAEATRRSRKRIRLTE